TDFTSAPGLGAQARVDGETVVVGNRSFLAAQNVSLSALDTDVVRLQGVGSTVVFVARGGALVGVITIADIVRATSAGAIERLRRLGSDVVMLRGDNRATAERIARDLGVERVLSEVLPAQKARQVRSLQGE